MTGPPMPSWMPSRMPAHTASDRALRAELCGGFALQAELDAEAQKRANDWQSFRKGKGAKKQARVGKKSQRHACQCAPMHAQGRSNGPLLAPLRAGLLSSATG